LNEVRRYFVDSNIFIYALDAADLAKLTRSTDVIQRLIESDSGIVSAQVLGETYSNVVKPTKLAMSPGRAGAVVEGIAAYFAVAILDLETVRDAMQISARYQTSYYDALLLAAAKAHGASFLLTEDLQAEQVIDGVRVLHVLEPGFDLSRLE
jgi:predicted nucleic acid-binding protein